MNEVTIEKKKYVLIPRKEYESLKRLAVKKYRGEKLLSLSEARAYSRELIHEWASER
jgi:hypothetical protein